MSVIKRRQPHQHTNFVDKYKYVYLPLMQYGAISIALASDAADQGAGALIHSAGTLGSDGSGSTAIHAEVGTTGIMGWRFREIGDDINLFWPIPADLDVEYDVEFSVIWSSDQTTTTDTVTWKILYDELTNDSEAIAAGTTALSTAIAADTNAAAANANQQTAWGKINGGTLEGGDPANRNQLSIVVECDAVTGATIASDLIFAHYLVIRYVRRML